MLQVEDDDIRSDLEKIQPVPAIDTRATISPEQVDNLSSPPSTACSGTLLAYTNPTVTGELKILNKIIIVFRYHFSSAICSTRFMQLCQREKIRLFHHLVLEILNLNKYCEHHQLPGINLALQRCDVTYI